MNCNDERLRTLLNDDEQSSAYRQAIAHVDSCVKCQSRIEQLAAAESMWQEAHATLSSCMSDHSDSQFVAQSKLPSNSQTDSQTASQASLTPQARRLRDAERLGEVRWRRRPTAWTEAVAKQVLGPPSHPEMLGRIGRYEVERLIGSGGMGIVFKAFDTELNRPVAVKVLAPHLAGHGAARQRFAREARAAAAVVHEHVVAIHNVETSGVSPFLVMQFIAGESLQQRIDREGPLDLAEVLRIAMQTAAGLAAAHAQGLVHRDVKPSNVLLEQGLERALLTDFGLARAVDDASLTHTGYHPGTPQYMSPEQARGESVDARSDLFSLGSVIYTMCTGRPPFRAETSYGVLRRITDNEPRALREVNASMPEWLERLVARLHAKSPDDRFASAEEVRKLLEQSLAHVQQPLTVELPESLRAAKPANLLSSASTRRWLVRSGVTFACLVALLGAFVPLFPGGSWLFDSDSRSSEAKQLSDDAATEATAGPNARSPATSEPNNNSDPVAQSDATNSAAWGDSARTLESLNRELKSIEANSRQLWPTLNHAKETE